MSTPIEPEHPEATCEECGGKNHVWHTDSHLWNEADPTRLRVLCPTCFMLASPREHSWKLVPAPREGDGDAATVESLVIGLNRIRDMAVNEEDHGYIVDEVDSRLAGIIRP